MTHTDSVEAIVEEIINEIKPVSDPTAPEPYKRNHLRQILHEKITTLQASQKPQHTDSVDTAHLKKAFFQEFFIEQNHPISGKLKVLKGTKSYDDIADWWIATLQATQSQQVEEAVWKAISLYDLEISPLLDTRLYPLLDKAKQRTLQQALTPNPQD